MLPENLDFLTLTYGFFNMLRLMSYAPQLVLLARDKGGAKAISVSSWLIWTGANFTTAVYAWVRLADVPLSLLNAFNTGCCATMLALLIYKRKTPGLGFSRTGTGGPDSAPHVTGGILPAESRVLFERWLKGKEGTEQAKFVEQLLALTE